MKVESFEWIYNINGIRFVDLNILEETVKRGFLDKNFYNYIKKKISTKIILYSQFEDLVKKYPKKTPCWCLSKRNYIDCHFNKIRIPTKSKNEIVKSYKYALNKKECLHHGVSSCSKDIIEAHSISKSNSLRSISENNHVYGTKIYFKELHFEKIGIKQASTFPGFCKKHDDLLFASFEKYNFEKTSKQLFDLCYRSICIEHYNLSRIRYLYENQKCYIDNSKDLIEQFEEQISLNSKIYFYNLGLKYSNNFKKKMEKIYSVTTHEDLLNHYIFELEEGYPKLQSSSCFNLEFDLNANRLQDLNKSYIQSKNLFINCLSLNNKGYFIISWFVENDNFGKQVIDSIIDIPKKIEDKLFSLVFLYILNTYVSPKWYEGLSKLQKEEFERIRCYWNEIDTFDTSLVISNFDSIKVKNHYFFIPHTSHD